MKEGKKEVLYVILDDTRGREEKKRKEKKAMISNCAYHTTKDSKNSSLATEEEVRTAHVKLPKFCFKKKFLVGHFDIILPIHSFPNIMILFIINSLGQILDYRASERICLVCLCLKSVFLVSYDDR